MESDFREEGDGIALRLAENGAARVPVASQEDVDMEATPQTPRPFIPAARVAPLQTPLPTLPSALSETTCL